jgi:hypothetical protein
MRIREEDDDSGDDTIATIVEDKPLLCASEPRNTCNARESGASNAHVRPPRHVPKKCAVFGVEAGAVKLNTVFGNDAGNISGEFHASIVM